MLLSFLWKLPLIPSGYIFFRIHIKGNFLVRVFFPRTNPLLTGLGSFILCCSSYRELPSPWLTNIIRSVAVDFSRHLLPRHSSTSTVDAYPVNDAYYTARLEPRLSGCPDRTHISPLFSDPLHRRNWPPQPWSCLLYTSRCV